MASDSAAARMESLGAGYRSDMKMVTQGKTTPAWTFDTLEYAHLLLDRGRDEDVARATEILENFFARQALDPPSRRGMLPIKPDKPDMDPNGNVFLAPFLLKIDRCAGKLPEAVRRRVAQGVRLAIEYAERRWDEDLFDLHRDNMGYSNIYALYVQALVLAARHYNEERLLRKCEGQWRRWFNHVAYYGLNEFCSPTYNWVVCKALAGIYDAAPNETLRFQCAQMLDYICALQYAICHPQLKMPVCGASRDYRGYVLPGKGAPETVVQEAEGAYVKPAGVLAEFQSRRYPHLARGRAANLPFRFLSWQERHRAMGSMTGGNYAWQQVHCSVAVGEDEDHRAVAALPGNNSRVNGYVAQREGAALCLFNRLPSSYVWTQHSLRDEEIQEKMREWKIHACAIGLTDAWRLEESSEGIIARAFGHTLTLRPFVIHEGRVGPVQLQPWPQDLPHHGMQSNRFHVERIYPEEALWFGCHVAVDAGDAPRKAPAVHFEQAGQVVRLSSDDGLSLRLFCHPTGETTQLYDDDWRTTPLLECPALTLWPGEMARRAANR